MSKRVSRELVRQVMAELGARGGKRSLETMTAEQRVKRAKKASLAAAKVRTAKRLAAAKTKRASKTTKAR